MYGIKGYIFADEGNLRQDFNFPPTEELTSYIQLQDFMRSNLEDIPRISGFLILLTSKNEV